MVRVAIVVKTFPPNVIGGMETQTETLASKLSSEGHEVTVFTKRFAGAADESRPFEMVWIPHWNVTPVVSDLTFLLFATFSLIRRREAFDVVQCMMLYPVGFLGYVVNRLTGLPYFAWIRGGDYYLMRDTWWKRWMMRRVLNDTLVLAQSTEIREDVIADFEDIECQIEILGNGVSIPEDTADGDGVLYVGRLAPKKGLKYLIEAMANIDAPLTIVGDGEERDNLEPLADTHDVAITFEGMVPPNEVDTYYRSAAVFVLPSIEGEGTPNVVLEAMAWGVPVVATDSGGVASLVNDGANGFLVPMRDTEALADRIGQLLEDDSLRHQLGTNAREFVAHNHSWDMITERLANIFNRIQHAD